QRERRPGLDRPRYGWHRCRGRRAGARQLLDAQSRALGLSQVAERSSRAGTLEVRAESLSQFRTWTGRGYAASPGLLIPKPIYLPLPLSNPAIWMRLASDPLPRSKDMSFLSTI